MSDSFDNKNEIIVDVDGSSALSPRQNDKKPPVNRKDMVKNFAIGFLSLMLVLTFFSNTIMNFSLSQVATQQITSGSISPQIRGTGVVSAEDPYNVTVKETRKVSGVAVKEGAHVEIGDVLFYLEDRESEELKSAKKELDDMELAYEQALFTGDIPDDVISRVRTGNTQTYDAYQLKLKEVNDRYDSAKAVADAATKAVEYLTDLKSHDSNEIDYQTLTYEYENANAEYQKNYAKYIYDSTDEAQNEIIQNVENEWDYVVAENNRETKELETYKNQLNIGYDQKLTEAKANESKAKKILEDAEAEKNKQIKSINAEISLCNQRDKIKEQKDKIAELEKESIGASIKAPVAGTVSQINKASGETVSADEAVAVIQIDGKDMTVSFSVTNAQAQKLNVGDPAKPQNSWLYGDDFKATLINIKNDKSDPSSKKQLTFKIESKDVAPGQSVALAIGERSVEYDMIVPKSAIKTGTTGKFVLVVNSKSSPLGNRYIASNVEVTVVASDDNYAAITAALNGDEYVITTSTKPVNAGDQVRLANE
ncbi:HlyD family efflux transporter periplasmic adaptor subunit [Butyrivibrio sp. YAB3001]|uniref:HlyD family efflux transporter periplasmic adaptor subunit n=1 Tax=Butyrivibrio sp. YAB3001 TaxID=1520812 RepID=UPI0008F61784|nr:HlyD family efflux transporter periplasmic adaptor subunit [Butyrivibrio sp. YAB3001]SFC36882.1 Biotin-lipoyl like [Butyrivibrio sp. YAB3001]